MEFFLLIAYLSYRNSLRAKLKEQNRALWVFITIVAFIMGYMIGLIVVIYFSKDAINMNQLMTDNLVARKAALEQFTTYLQNKPLDFFTLDIGGFGGYLLIRYILDKMPDKKQEEVHWMDRMNDRKEL